MEGELQKTLGSNLRALRQDRGLSQEKMAEQLGFHRTYYSDLELGKRNPSLRSVERLAEGLGVDPLALLRGIAEER